MAAVNSPQDSDLPSYGQVQGLSSKTETDPSPIPGVRATLETMLQEVDQDLFKVITLLKEISGSDTTQYLSRDTFFQMGMLHFYMRNRKDDAWKSLHGERLRLLERKDYLRIELAKASGQEQQQERDLQAWLEVDCIRAKRLAFIDALMEGLQTILRDESKPKSALSQDSRQNVIFDQILTLPEGRGIQPFVHLKHCDHASIKQYCTQELGRLGSKRDELDPVTMCLTNAPPGAWDRRATASSIPLNNHYMAHPPSFSSASASSSSFIPAAPAPSAIPIYTPRQL